LTAQRLPILISPQLVKACAHPTRLRLLTILKERTASPSELAVATGEALNNVSYHIKKLAQLGCIELVRVESVKGDRVVQRFYRATVRPYVDAEDWDAMNDSEKHAVWTTLMLMVNEDLSEAMASGTFYDPDDNHLSRTPMVVDAEGWEEIIFLLDDVALERLPAIQENVYARAKDGEAKRMNVRVEILHFRSPDSKKKAEG
jgi:DNA-binding transcriptional ArsR family regulator